VYADSTLHDCRRPGWARVLRLMRQAHALSACMQRSAPCYRIVPESCC